MSRNLRQRPATTAITASKRRGSRATSPNLSSDDGYSGVDDISDSEDDDEDNVDAAEEEHIISIERSRGSTSPRPDSEEDDEDEDADDDDEVDDGDIDETGSSWDGVASEDEGPASDTSVQADDSQSPTHTAQVERHVRFAGVPESDSDSTDTDDDHASFFPDIFVDQSTLDPALRREIEVDPDESSNSSFWDYHGVYDYHSHDSDVEVVIQTAGFDTPSTPFASQETSIVSTPTRAVDASPDLDGYETDGDTTEEDVPEPAVKRKTRRPEVFGETSDSDCDNKLIKFRRGQPRVGRFNLDKSEKKPIAVVNPISKKMMIFTPHRRRQLDLSPEQFNFPLFNQQESYSPILSHSASVMMSAMFSSNTFGDFMNSQTVGPAEAFFPFISGVNGEESLDSSLEEDEDEGERNLDISDFITWDEGESSESDSQGWEMDKSPTQPQPSSSSETDVLAHLTGDTVGAFRRNQINQQLISQQATEDSLAFSGPYNYTALRGLKADRFDVAAAPITPIRRRKNSVPDSSPLESMAQKRKASGEDPHGHKRHRSISDVNLLQI